MSTIENGNKLSKGEPSQSLKDVLITMGLNAKNLEVGLVVPSDRKTLISKLVSDHLKAHGIECSGGFLGKDRLIEQVLFIEEPKGEISRTTPVLSRIAAGIKKHHNGARLAVDISGELIVGYSRGVFHHRTNTVVIPWSLVIDPNAVNSSETFGHELIHLKQLSDGHFGIQLNATGHLKVAPHLERFYSNEIETHIFNFWHAFRRLPEPTRLNDFSRTELKELLLKITNEAIDIVLRCQCLEMVLPLLRDAMNRGEAIFCINSPAGSQISEWGIVIARGTDCETIATFCINNDQRGDLLKQLEANVDECQYVLNADYIQFKAIEGLARSVIETMRYDMSILGIMTNTLSSLYKQENKLKLVAEYSKLHSLVSDYGRSRRENRPALNQLVNEENASTTDNEIFSDINKWLTHELHQKCPALQAILTQLVSMELSRESIHKLISTLENRIDIVNLWPIQSSAVTTVLIHLGDDEMALNFGLFLINHLTKRPPELYNNVAWLMYKSGDTSGKAVEYSKKSIALLKAQGGPYFHQDLENYEDTLAHALGTVRKSTV